MKRETRNSIRALCLAPATSTPPGNLQKMSMPGDTDKGFAMLMKIYHQQTVDMPLGNLTHGKSAAMKAMAKQILAAQQKEITQFDRWFAKPE